MMSMLLSELSVRVAARASSEVPEMILGRDAPVVPMRGKARRLVAPHPHRSAECAL